MLENQHRIDLRRAEAVCLEALRSGARTKSRVAVDAGVTLNAADRALRRLAKMGLAVSIAPRPGGPIRWEPTELGEHATITAVEGKRRKRQAPEPDVRPGSSAEQPLQQLEPPKRVTELAAAVGITRQRVHRPLALGLVRSADPSQPSRIVAQPDDPTILLRWDEERVLSAFPDESATTTRNLATRVKLPASKLDEAIGILSAHGLVEKSGEDASRAHFRLTRAGAEHFQRNRWARRAHPPILPVKVRPGPVGAGLSRGQRPHAHRPGRAGPGHRPDVDELTREGLRVRHELMRRSASPRE